MTTYLISDESLVKPRVKLLGIDGNAMNVMAVVSKAWEKMGRRDIAKEVRERIFAADGYNDGPNSTLSIATEYVDLEYIMGDAEEDEDEDEEDEFNFFGDDDDTEEETEPDYEGEV